MSCDRCPSLRHCGGVRSPEEDIACIDNRLENLASDTADQDVAMRAAVSLLLSLARCDAQRRVP